MGVISMKQLLEAGVHFGHQTRRWNPKMAPYIYTERNGIYIIDLQKSVGKVDEAYKAVADIAADGGTILFVGTKKQAQDAIATEATALRYVLREREMAWRYADKLQDNPEPYRSSESRSRLWRADGTFEVLPKKEVIAAEERAGQTAEEPWRYQRYEETAGRYLRSRPEKRKNLYPGSSYTGHPADRYL